MTAPSFHGLKLYLRYKDRSIEQEVHRLELAKNALIGFIDLMLLAGLYLVFVNVRREVHLSRLKERLRGQREPRAEDPLALIRLSRRPWSWGASRRKRRPASTTGSSTRRASA